MSRARRWIVAAVVLSSAGALAAPASASLVFTSPFNLTSGTQNASTPQVAFDRSGNALAVWQRSYAGGSIVESSFRPAGGGFQTPEIVSNPEQTALDPRVAFDRSGNALVVWRRYLTSSNQVVQASFRPAGGGFASLPDLSAAGHYAYDPHVAFDGYGNALVVWWGDDGSTYRVLGSFRAAGGIFEASPAYLSAPGEEASKPQVALDGSGNAIAVWEHAVPLPPPDIGVYYAVVQESFRPAGGTSASSFQAPAHIAALGRDSRAPQIAFDGSGNALAVWTRANHGGAQDSVQASFRPAGGAFQASPVDISPTGSTQVAGPQLAFDAAGNALAVWRRSNGTNLVVQSAFRPTAGAFAPSVDLSAAGQDGENAQVAFDGSGSALAVWSNLKGAVQGAFRAVAGPFQAPFGLSADDQLTIAPQLALDASGKALVVWSALNADGYSVVQAVFGGPASSGIPPPQLPPVSVPGGGGGGAGGGGGTAPPRVGGASVSPTTFSVSPQGKAERPVSAAAKRGTRFFYTLSEVARVVFKIERAARGRRVGARCVKATRSNRKRKSCARFAKIGAFAQSGVQGKNVKPFSGRIGKKSLSRGRYRATLTATNSAGKRSVAKRLKFTVVRR